MPTEEPVTNWYMLRIWLKMAVESGHLSTLPPQAGYRPIPRFLSPLSATLASSSMS